MVGVGRAGRVRRARTPRYLQGSLRRVETDRKLMKHDRRWTVDFPLFYLGFDPIKTTAHPGKTHPLIPVSFH